MKQGDLVWWTHEHTNEKHILFVLEICKDGRVKCMFPYGAYYYADPKTLEPFKNVF